MRAWKVIGSPRTAHGVDSEKAYRLAQERALSILITLHPHLEARMPWSTEQAAMPFVSGGRWVLRCECKNAPSYSPEWGVARCFECGAVFRVNPPESWREIERVLLKRPEMRTRHWLPTETVETLIAENIAHGVERI